MSENINKNIGSNDILIVDDEMPNLKLLSELLGGEGYQVRPANNPQMAIDSALTQPPKLILLDVRMPQMDGFKVCERLKQDERTCDIPIIFISALQDVEDRIRGFNAGGVDFISKPFQEEEVLARVRTHLDLRSMQLNLEELVEQRTAELTRSEARYRGLVENALVGVFNSTLDGKFSYVNDAMAKMFDFENPDQMISRGSIERWSDPNDRERMLAELKKHGIVTNFETRTITHTGRHIYVLFSAKLVGDDIVGMVMDISKRKQSENMIKAYQERLKVLAYETAIAEEKERRVIATDLHDYVGQSLALARMQIATLKTLCSENELTGQLDEISKTLLTALEDTQKLMLGLSSTSMHDIGLSAAVSEWMEVQPYHLEVEVVDNLPENRRKSLSEEMRTILFRNIRELITNTFKHARASKVSVRLENRDPNLRIIVEDDGVGFNPSDGSQNKYTMGGFGLFRIEELMVDIGGNLKIVSAPGKGCTAILSVPFSFYDNQRRV